MKKYLVFLLLVVSCKLEDKPKAHRKLAEGYRRAALKYNAGERYVAESEQQGWNTYVRVSTFVNTSDSLRYDSLMKLSDEHTRIADSLEIEDLKTAL